MFCTACATPNHERSASCGVCGATLAALGPASQRPGHRGGRALSRLLRWCRLVPALAVMLGLAGVWTTYARQSDRQADAYAVAEAALVRGDTAAAAAALDRAGAYRDAETRRVALTAQLAPYRVAYIGAVDALGAGDAEAAIALLTSIVRDEPAYEDAASLLELARERRRATLASDAELAASRQDWLTAESLLAQLEAEHPDPERRAELQEIRRRRAPVLFTVNGNIQLATPEGHDPVVILDGYSALYPTWSPDRRAIAFYTTRVEDDVVTFDLQVIDRDGTGIRLVADHVFPESFAAWSPDGSRIAYINQQSFQLDGRPGITSIRVADLATDTITDLTDRSVHQAFSPSWSPDGGRVAFISKQLYGRRSTVTWRQTGSVHVADLDRGAVADVTGDRLRYVESVSWSPTSDHLALWARESASSFQETTVTTIHLLDLTTGAITDVTTRAQFVSSPIWAPDGERFAYVDGDRIVKISGVDGSTQTIAQYAPIFPALSWSPDGASLLVPLSRPQLGSPIVPVEDNGAVGFHFPIAWDLAGNQVGPPRWSGGRPVANPVGPTLDGTALDHP